MAYIDKTYFNTIEQYKKICEIKVSEQIAIMKAYEDGKTIEQKRYDGTDWKSLKYVENYPFDFVLNEYRIAIEPKYRPYESIKEAFDEAKKHGFWVKDKNKECLLCIKLIELTKEKVIYLGYNLYSGDVLEKYVWADDNSPCGIKIQ